MKTQRTHHSLWTIVVVLLTVVLIEGAASARETIQLVAFNYAPYYSDANLENKGHGFVSDLVTAAFDAADVEVVITYQPVARSAQSFKEGKFVAYVGSKEAFLPTIHADKVDILSLCTYHNRFNYFKSHINKELTYSRLEDLKGYRIGDVVGSHLEKDLRQAGLTVDLAPTLEQGMKKLDAGRIDLWVAVGLTAYFLVETNFPERLDDLAFIEKPAGSGTVDVSFLKAHKDYAKMKALYEKGLQIIRENGKYQEILERYFGKGIVFEDALSSCS